MAVAVPPLDTSSQPSSTRPSARSTTPVLSYTDSRARTSGQVLRRGFRVRDRGQGQLAGDDGGEGVRVEAALDGLDALVEGVDGVVGEDGHRLLGHDRPGVHLEGGHVDGAPGDLHPVGQGVGHPVPAGERRQQGRVGVEDPPAERVEDGLVEDGAEAGHGHQVDLGLVQDVHDLLGVGHPIEIRAEVLPLDHPGVDAGPLGHLDGTTRAVDDDDDHGQGPVEHGLENGPAPRGQHTDAHDRTVPARYRSAGGLPVTHVGGRRGLG